MHASQVYKKYLMWGLYALLFLLTLLVEEVALGRQRFFGAKLSLLPMVIVLISMRLGHEVGGLFSLLCALFWCCTGADDGPVSILTWTVLGIAAGYLCTAVFRPGFLQALGLSAFALLFHEGIVFFLNFYFADAAPALGRWVLISTGLSLLACPILYLICRGIGKVVD